MNRMRKSDFIRHRIIGYFLALSFGIVIGFIACYYSMHQVAEVKTVVLPSTISVFPVTNYKSLETEDDTPEFWLEFGLYKFPFVMICLVIMLFVSLYSYY